jgi:hypothetical protein
MILPAIVFLILNKGVISIIPFLFVTLMATLFIIFLINACYILILKLTTPSKFQSIISYIQIAFAILFYAGYQLVPRLMDEISISQYEISEYAGIILLPTYWFAGAWQQLYGWDNTLQLWLCLTLTIMVPLLSIWIVIKYFAPSFNQKLSMITGSTGEFLNTDKPAKKNASSFYSSMLSKLFTKKGVERTSFLFTWKMMLRSSDFKMKVYPAIGYIVVVIVATLIRDKTFSFADVASQTKHGIFYTLALIYCSNLLLIAALGQITMYEKYKAAWIFFITPVAHPGKLISGSIKAAIAQFFFPLVLAIFIFITSLAGPIAIPNLLLGIANELLVTAIAAYMGVSKLPFSSPQQIDSGNTIRVLAAMTLGIVVAFIHYLLYRIIVFVSIFAALSFVASWYIFNAVSNLSWQKIYRTYNEI